MTARVTKQVTLHTTACKTAPVGNPASLQLAHRGQAVILVRADSSTRRHLGPSLKHNSFSWVELLQHLQIYAPNILRDITGASELGGGGNVKVGFIFAPSAAHTVFFSNPLPT